VMLNIPTIRLRRIRNCVSWLLWSVGRGERQGGAGSEVGVAEEARSEGQAWPRSDDEVEGVRGFTQLRASMEATGAQICIE
jgi:hypothetical protein